MQAQQRGPFLSSLDQHNSTQQQPQNNNNIALPPQILLSGESPKQKNTTNRPLQKKLDDDTAQILATLNNSPTKQRSLQHHQRAVGEIFQDNSGKGNSIYLASGDDDEQSDAEMGVNAACVESSESDNNIGHNLMMMIIEQNRQAGKSNQNARLGPNRIQMNSISGTNQEIFYSARSQLSKHIKDAEDQAQLQLNHQDSHGQDHVNSQPQPFSIQNYKQPPNICININELHINSPQQTNSYPRQATTSMQRQPPHLQMMSSNLHPPQQQPRSTSIKNFPAKKPKGTGGMNMTVQQIQMPGQGAKGAKKIQASKQIANDNLRKASEAARKQASTIAVKNTQLIDKQTHSIKSPKAVNHKSSPMNRKKVASRKKSAGGQEGQRNSFSLMNDEEEKVPNEHPLKRSSIGLGTYQTNYFSQSSEVQNFQDSLAFKFGIPPDVLNLGIQTERHRSIKNRQGFDLGKAEKDLGGSLEALVVGNLSAKKRQPTMMPFNLPGDDLDQLDKNDESKAKNFFSKQSPVILDQGELMNPFSQVPQSKIGDNIDSEMLGNSENFKTFEIDGQLNLQNNPQMMRPQIGLRVDPGSRVPTQQIPNKDPKDMTHLELIEEVELLRKELNQKEQKLKKIANDGQRLRRENQQLGFKLQFEIKNNSMLVKNINRIRQNYFQNIHQSPQNAGRNSNVNFSNQVKAVVQSPQTGQNVLVQMRAQNRPNTNIANRAQQNVIKNQNKQNIEDLEEEKTPQSANIQKNQSSTSQKSSEIAGSQLGQKIEQDSQNQLAQGININSQGTLNQEGHVQRTTGLLIGRGRVTMRRQNIQMVRQNQQHRRQNHNAAIIEEDASILETQQNDETVLINKVNEMQIKTSRFDQPFLHFQSSLGNQNYYRSEDFIPNEEPLINMREFWGSDNLSHSYRMRIPAYQQALYNHQMRMRISPAGLTDLYQRAGGMRYPAGVYQIPQGLMQMRNIQFREGAARIANVNPAHIPARRTFGLAANHRTNHQINQNVQEFGGMRIRVASHGPPLRNINGDSHSLMEEDIQDQTFMMMAAQPNHNAGTLNNTNIIVSATGNLGQMLHPQLRASHIQYHSDDSIIDLEEEEKHQALPMRNHQMFLQFNNRGGFANYRPMMGAPIITSNQMSSLHPGGGFSFDDGGMDEYDVADERAHLWEFINPDNMTYEEILALQDRIGYVSKGLTRDQINNFPKMRRRDVQEYLEKFKNQEDIQKESSQTPRKTSNNPNLIEEEKKELDPREMDDLSIRDLSEIEIKNPLTILEEVKSNKKTTTRKGQPTKRKVAHIQPFHTFGNPLLDDEICDEEIDGDEGIISRRLPLNSYNNQPQVDDQQKRETKKKNSQTKPSKKFNGMAIQFLHQSCNANKNSLEEEEGCENCKEEDEERKEGEAFDESISRKVLVGKEKDPHLFDVDSSNDVADIGVDEIQPNSPQIKSTPEGNNYNQSNMQSENSSLVQQKERCAICFDGMKKNDYVKILTCNHYYHIECIDQWLLVEKRCPMCMMYLDNKNPEGAK